VSTAPLTPLAGEVRYLAPISGISQIPATGFNYEKHIEEMKVPAPIEFEVFSNRCHR
jgi:5-carboxymethyl-2-hydroxymuconate isomerase